MLQLSYGGGYRYRYNYHQLIKSDERSCDSLRFTHVCLDLLENTLTDVNRLELSLKIFEDCSLVRYIFERQAF